MEKWELWDAWELCGGEPAFTGRRETSFEVSLTCVSLLDECPMVLNRDNVAMLLANLFASGIRGGVLVEAAH